MGRRGWGAATGGSTGIQKGESNYFRLGDFKAMCGTCARIQHGSQMRKLSVYDGGWYVCDRCFETPNPQQFLRGRPDGQPPPWTQPRPPPVFASGNGGADLMTQPIGGSLVVNAQMVGAFMLG